VDPSKVSTAQLLRDFIGFDTDAPSGGIAVRDSDHATLVFVGARGSGRTTYLRRARALAAQRADVLALPIEDEGIPQTDLIRQVCAWYAPAVVVRRVQQVWRAAVLRALAARALRDHRLGEPLGSVGSAGQHDFHQTFFAILEGSDADHSGWAADLESVYGQIAMIISGCASARDLDELVLSDLWDRLESRLAVALEMSPQVVIYLDALDQEFRHAPQEWLIWEKALFYQTFHFARHPGLAKRVQVVTTIRDITYSAVRGGDSGTKYPPGAGIRVLAWDPASTSAFLEAKIDGLSSHWLLDAGADAPSERWLGASRIRNQRLGHDEDILAYIASHTRGVPRDVVQVGNSLCEAVWDAKTEGEEAVSGSVVRDIVEQVAFAAGREQLAIAAADAASCLGDVFDERELTELDSDPDSEGDWARLLPSQRTMADQLEDLVTRVSTRYFSREDFVYAQEAVGSPASDIDVLSVLWRNGLVGVWQKTACGETPIFYTPGVTDRLRMPGGAERFAFHRLLIDVAGLAPGWDTDGIDEGLYVESASGDTAEVASGLAALVALSEGMAELAWMTRTGKVHDGEARAEARRGGRLDLVSVVLKSPGFWVFGGSGESLRELRGVLADRHVRRQDRAYREQAEEDRLGLENDLLRLEVVQRFLVVATTAGMDEAERQSLLRRTFLAGAPGRVSDVEQAFDLGTARLLDGSDEEA
jgi:hypothetical protein